MDAHQRARRDLIAALKDGDPCCRCGRPMYRARADELDADHHKHPRALYPGALPDALAHRSCNRSHGARLKMLLRGQVSKGRPAAPRAEPVVTSREW